jgi:serine/threonine protein kinase
MRTRTGQPSQAFHPARIGPYEVLRRLGAGAMGEVFLARSPSSRLVAVKTIRSGLAEHPGYRRRFAHEVDSAKRVSGAFTAAVVGADPHADLPWLATVYVPAPSLEELVAECGPQTVPAVRWLAAGCAEALEAVHRVGLVHRDFKPANVLVTADGPRVIDFGLARSDGLPQGTAVGMVLGTPLYMAPEQAAGEPVVGPAADVFALGATLYHAATGKALYQEEKAVGVLLQKMRQPPNLTPLPRELRGLVAACLALHPDDRPTPASLVAALAPHLAMSDAARPLPESVLDYIENYRGQQMELTRSKRSLPEADTAVLGEKTHVAARDEESLVAFGDLTDPDGEGGGVGLGATGIVEEEDPRPRHPSLLPGPVRSPGNRRRGRRAGQWDHQGRFRRRSPLGPAVVTAGVVVAFAAATVTALFLAGVVTLGSKDAGPSPAAGVVSGSATNGSQPPARTDSPPPTNSPPPAHGNNPPPGGGPQGGPPPGSVVDVNGVHFGVRPPWGDPTTTFVVDGFGWPAGQMVTVAFLDAKVPPMKTVVDGSGTFSVALDRGAGSVTLADGRYHVKATVGSTSETISFVVGPPLN